ncbi:MAG: hypothetical protein [Olavius algarvensis spirochete endosymbiont]|nr:MAG: hypothetical protein [Olavius algarvensis spirochete endosymbiont]
MARNEQLIQSTSLTSFKSTKSKSLGTVLSGYWETKESAEDYEIWSEFLE